VTKHAHARVVAARRPNWAPQLGAHDGATHGGTARDGGAHDGAAHVILRGPPSGERLVGKERHSLVEHLGGHVLERVRGELELGARAPAIRGNQR
jgi:hypothetical protein